MERSRRRDPRQLLSAVAVAVALIVACGNDSVPSASTTVPPVPTGPVPSVAAVAAATPAPSPTRTPTPTATPLPSPSPDPTSGPTATPRTAEAPTCSGTESPTHGGVATGSSRNWAGYIVHQTGARVVCVQGRWTEPRLTCPTKGDRSVAIWVGIDGATTASRARPLIQIGTWGYCHNGVENHYAWHEVYPTQPFSIPFGAQIRPGDRMAAAVVFRKRAFTLTLVNLTTGRRMEVIEEAPKATRGTAEWIVEAPSGACSTTCHQLALPKFAPVRFTEARATLGSRIAGIDGPWMRDRTIMRSRRGVLVNVGQLSNSGEGFVASHP